MQVNERLQQARERAGYKEASEAAVCSWGPYQRINRSGGEFGTFNRIVISLGTYIYTRNGRVSSWQD